jgi:hypothetical protein
LVTALARSRSADKGRVGQRAQKLDEIRLLCVGQVWDQIQCPLALPDFGARDVDWSWPIASSPRRRMDDAADVVYRNAKKHFVGRPR